MAKLTYIWEDRLVDGVCRHCKVNRATGEVVWPDDVAAKELKKGVKNVRNRVSKANR